MSRLPPAVGLPPTPGSPGLPSSPQPDGERAGELQGVIEEMRTAAAQYDREATANIREARKLVDAEERRGLLEGMWAVQRDTQERIESWVKRLAASAPPEPPRMRPVPMAAISDLNKSYRLSGINADGTAALSCLTCGGIYPHHEESCGGLAVLRARFASRIVVAESLRARDAGDELFLTAARLLVNENDRAERMAAPLEPQKDEQGAR